MPISRPQAPAEIAAAFLTQLPEYVAIPEDDRSREVDQGYAGPAPEAPTLGDLGQTEDRIFYHDAQQVFVLGLSDAANNGETNVATPAGWRFFAGNEPGRILMGRVSRRTDSKGWRMTAGYYGDRVWDASVAARALEELPQARDGNYELRILTVPGLNLEAFWLVAQDPDSPDLVVPFPNRPNQPIEALNQEAVYTMAHFLAAIRPVAQLRLHAESRYGS